MAAPAQTTCVPYECRGDEYIRPGSKNTQVQLVISSVLGLTAFITFCILRPRWKTLYQARKRNLHPSVNLPSLPDSFLGWIPVLYRVTDEQVLQSAGLDAFVFLKFFKVSIRLFSVMLFFAATVLWPVNNHYWGDYTMPTNRTEGDCPGNDTHPSLFSPSYELNSPVELAIIMGDSDRRKALAIKDKSFLWSYLIFTWFFTFLVIYYINSETFRVNKVRQQYLGTQTTVTDRTFRLTGIPKDLRTEENIKNLIEKLEIGRVDNVTLCYDWRELDHLMEKRKMLLCKLEGKWAEYLQMKPKKDVGGAGRSQETEGESPSPDATADEEAGENGRLIRGANVMPDILDHPRPQIRIWYGFLYLQSRWTDAIDNYEEKLRLLDERIVRARTKKYTPADLAFVTMDSTAACQMAIQAVLCPTPGQLLTKPAPAPADVLWKNTYKSRLVRRLRGWSITIFVSFLSLIWLVPVASLASLLSICTISKVFPEFVKALHGHEITLALVQTGLPTAVVSLLNIAVPYLYDWLSYRQGQISKGDVELSIVSKNFFFTFFNIFLVFAVSGTATGFWSILRDVARDTTRLPTLLAQKIISLNSFYLNFIMLQGIGLFPFKLLDFGNATLFPILRVKAKTPRDYAEIRKPSIFSYGFYLPTALLVFILCVVYSVLPMGYLVLSFGLVYFILGYFTYKYQLLYAMDQPQHATGGAWRIICYRVVLGLVVFQLVMSGIIALLGSWEKSALVVPLLLITVWYSVYWKRRFEPLTKFIALRSVRYYGDDLNTGEGGRPSFSAIDGEDYADVPEPRELFRRGSTVDEDREKGARFINPNLVSRLQPPWIHKNSPPLPSSRDEENEDGDNGQPPIHSVYRGNTSGGGSSSTFGSAAGSEFSLGDTHIWRHNTDSSTV